MLFQEFLFSPFVSFCPFSPAYIQIYLVYASKCLKYLAFPVESWWEGVKLCPDWWSLSVVLQVSHKQIFFTLALLDSPPRVRNIYMHKLKCFFFRSFSYVHDLFHSCRSKSSYCSWKICRALTFCVKPCGILIEKMENTSGQGSESSSVGVECLVHL